MLSDRPYMRDDYQRERTSFLIWLLSGIIAGFVVQKVFQVWLGSPSFEQLAALSAWSIRNFYAWTLLTYPLLHDGVLHLLVMVLGLYFLGRELVPHLGERRLTFLTVAAVIAGGLAWYALNFNRAGHVVGAAPIVLCYLIVFACLFPNREMSFLVFFVIPVTTRPKYLAWIALAIDGFGFLFSEIPGGKFQSGIPHSAHLGAMLAGWLYYRFFHEANWLVLRRSTEMELPRWMTRAKKSALPTTTTTANATTREDIRAEVDRILDKINSHGFGALTPDEKRVLDDAKALLSRR
ncbi:MAG: rhomboid family intramembrane serine protease [Opitutaceae bacterium]|nr:rhomboid family intramembrane serine protease [Opitutaceae bacterium]